jgi:hypothetical protein
VSAHWRYLVYVVRHKWFVLLAGMKTGAPMWRLLIHDLSKFGRREWGPYVSIFYGPPSDTAEISVSRALAFDRAWLHHQHANPHHWQHWILRQDDGDVKVLRMPAALVREMVADWAGAGRAITGKWGPSEWYWKNRDKMLLHPETRAQVERLLETCRFGSNP